MFESSSCVVTKEHELRLQIADSVKEMRGSVLRMQAHLENEAYIRIGLQLQIDELNSESKKSCSIWSMTTPQLTDIPPADLLQEEELEGALAAAEEGYALVVQQLQGMRQTLRVQAHRRHNSTSLLLSLPLGVLQRIIPKGKKQTRLACSTFRDAYGTPGTGVLLPHPSTDPPTTTARANAYLRSWPLPCNVTQLRALSFLPASTCEALSTTFRRLQAVTVLGGMESFAAMAPGAISSLVLGTRTPPGQLGQPEDPLRGCSRQFPALRSLCLTGCTAPSLLDDLSPLAALTQLTSLSLLASDDHKAAAEDSEVHRGWPALAGRRAGTPYAAYAACNQGVWGVLAALPGLARLHMDVRFNYHSALPAVPALPALTHLAVLAEPTMAQRDARRGVELPLVRVLDLLPALVSLEVLDPVKRSGAVWNAMAGSQGLQMLMQDLQQRGLQDVQLPQFFGPL